MPETYLESQDAEKLSLEQAFEHLGSSPLGLEAAEAARRLAQVGPNAIQERKKSSLLKLLG